MNFVSKIGITIVIGFLLGFFIHPYISFITVIIAAIIVYQDAKSRGESPLGWALITFLFLIIGLPAYYFSVVTKKPVVSESFVRMEIDHSQISILSNIPAVITKGKIIRSFPKVGYLNIDSTAVTFGDKKKTITYSPSRWMR